MVQSRGEWDALPGLAAQMPESALVGVLNLPGVSVSGDLSVIAGDTQAAGVRRRLGAGGDAGYGASAG